MSITRAPKTIVVYDITGQADYTIPFEFLARKFVVLTLLGQDRKVLTLNTDYRFVTKNTISLANPNPAGYESIEIRRFTSATERLVDFHDGSILRAYDLNLSQIQTLHVAEEARDLAGDSIGVNDDGFLDARGRKIVNLGDATEDNDAVNLSQLRQFDTSTANNADRAEAAKVRAVQAETRSVNAETRSIEAEVKSIASSGASMQAAMDSRKSLEETRKSEAAGKISETNAKVSEEAAAESAAKAKEEADKLANINEFAASIDNVADSSVTFNRDINYNEARGNIGLKSLKDDVEAINGKFIPQGETNWANIINKVPVVSSSGVMEVGKCIDFHDANSTADYDARIQMEGTELQVHGSRLVGVQQIVGVETQRGGELWANAGLLTKATDGQNPRVGFEKSGHSAASLEYWVGQDGGGNRFKLLNQAQSGTMPIEVAPPINDGCAVQTAWGRSNFGNIYKGGNNKEIGLPVGHTMIAWTGAYFQDRVNNHVTCYLTNDNNGYPRYGVNGWYGSHVQANLHGTWQFRGYVYAMAGINTGLLVRIA